MISLTQRWRVRCQWVNIWKYTNIPTIILLPPTPRLRLVGCTWRVADAPQQNKEDESNQPPTTTSTTTHTAPSVTHPPYVRPPFPLWFNSIINNNNIMKVGDTRKFWFPGGGVSWQASIRFVMSFHHKYIMHGNNICFSFSSEIMDGPYSKSRNISFVSIATTKNVTAFRDTKF